MSVNQKRAVIFASAGVAALGVGIYYIISSRSVKNKPKVLW